MLAADAELDGGPRRPALLRRDPHQLADAVDAHMSPALPMVGAGEPVQAAVDALHDADAVIVLEDGKPEGVVTRQDLLGYLTA